MGAELAGQAAVNVTNAAINTGLNYWLGSEARKQNYEYGELAAQHADARTRALYNDLQSPSALLNQYKEAGLSPSLMFGGSGAGGATPAQGAQGTGAAGISPAYGQMDALNIAQLELMNAEKKKTEAEAENIGQDTQLKEAETAFKELENEIKRRENKRDKIAYTLTTTYLTYPDGRIGSIYEIARESNDYGDYMEMLRKCADATKDKNTKELYLNYINSEEGQKVLRETYRIANSLEKEISILSSADVSAAFQAKIANMLNKEGFAEQNAKAAVEQLKAAAASSELTERQKNAWNRMLKMLGDHWYSDLIICLGMIFGNFATNSNIKINTGENNITIKKD